ncbi:MAG: organomercurial lyase MerB [Actinomycetota bacterium]
MPSPNVKEVATELARTLRRTPAGEPIGVLGPALLRLLARGKPVAPVEIAAATGVPQEEVKARLAAFPDTEFDEDGNLVGMGLTLRPTQHRFEIDGRQLYTWCALDTLMYPSILGTSARIESPCRATGDLVQVEIGPEGIERVDPATAVVSIVMPEDSCNLRGGFCNEVHFFRSQEAAGEWFRAHPGALILPVAEAFEVGQALNDATYGCC